MTHVRQVYWPIPPFGDPQFTVHFMLDGAQELGTADTEPPDYTATEPGYATASFTTSQIPAGRHWIDLTRTDGRFSPLVNQVSVLVLSPVEHGGTLENLYRLLLNRPPDPGGAAYFAGKPAAYVAAFLESSTERHRLIVNDLLYPRYLRRDADPGGSAYFTGLLDAGYSIRQVTSFMLSSPEYMEHTGGGALISYRTVSLYLDLFGRFGDASERAYWDPKLATVNPGAFVNAIVSSDEASRRIVDEEYQLYLQRPADSAAQAYWGGAMHAGLSVEGFTVALVASPEFAARWS